MSLHDSAIPQHVGPTALATFFPSLSMVSILEVNDPYRSFTVARGFMSGYGAGIFPMQISAQLKQCKNLNGLESVIIKSLPVSPFLTSYTPRIAE